MKEVSIKQDFKSRIYQIDNSVNVVVAAASPLISLLTRVHGIDPKTNMPDAWQEICEHELNICLDKCREHGFKELDIIASAITSWMNKNCIWPFKSNYNLFNTEELENLITNPEQHIEILELIFILNRLGMPLSDNNQINELKTQELFYTINAQKQHKINQKEQKSNIIKWQNATKTHKKNQQSWYIFLGFGTSICLINIWLMWQGLAANLKNLFFSNQVF